MIALIAGILIGVVQGDLADSILMHCILTMPMFVGMGWLIGTTADITIRESLESNFRKKVERMREQRRLREKSE